jgi:hypothetical protein
MREPVACLTKKKKRLDGRRMLAEFSEVGHTPNAETIAAIEWWGQELRQRPHGFVLEKANSCPPHGLTKAF